MNNPKLRGHLQMVFIFFNRKCLLRGVSGSSRFCLKKMKTVWRCPLKETQACFYFTERFKNVARKGITLITKKFGRKNNSDKRLSENLTVRNFRRPDFDTANVPVICFVLPLPFEGYRRITFKMQCVISSANIRKWSLIKIDDQVIRNVISLNSVAYLSLVVEFYLFEYSRGNGNFSCLPFPLDHFIPIFFHTIEDITTKIRVYR